METISKDKIKFFLNLVNISGKKAHDSIISSVKHIADNSQKGIVYKQTVALLVINYLKLTALQNPKLDINELINDFFENVKIMLPNTKEFKDV